MSSRKDQELLEYLKDLALEDYCEAFQKEKLTIADLEGLEEEDIEGIFKKKVHKKRFLKSLESLSPKKKGSGRVETKQKKEGVMCEKEEKRVHMFVKCKQEVRKIYDVPLRLSNEDLISKMYHAFIEGEVKLQGEKIALSKDLKSFTLQTWVEKNELPAGEMIRAVLSHDGGIVEGGSSAGIPLEEVEKLKTENEKLKSENEILKKGKEKLEKRVQELEMEVRVKLSAEKKITKKLKVDLVESKRALDAEKAKMKKKLAEIKKQPSTVPRGFKSRRGILVPQNVVFEVNEMFRSRLKKMFPNGNKVAKGIGETLCFKTSAVFTAGKKFYFQVSANVGNGRQMGFGIMSGEVTVRFVGDHEKGWDYNCFPGTKRTFHNKKQSSYGSKLKRTLGKHTFGVFCDFTKRKGEVSFIVDGKNWGVAYENVKPPVSPAFYIQRNEDSFKIEDTFEVPDCV